MLATQSLVSNSGSSGRPARCGLPRRKQPVEGREIFIMRRIGHRPIVPMDWIHRVLLEGASVEILIRGRCPWAAADSTSDAHSVATTKAD